MIHLVCSSNAAYMPRMMGFLDSINATNQGGRNWLVCLGCDVPEWIGEYPRVTAVTMTKEQNNGSPPQTESVQHGSFLQVIEYEPGDTIIYSDGDIVVQRPFTNKEVAWLKKFPNDTIAASWNSGPDEKLITEALRLSPQVNEAELVNTFGDLILREPCFNVGVVVAKATTWERLYLTYLVDWPKACESFGHQARQQWLICYERAALEMKYQVLPQEFHTHAHYNLPADLCIVNNVACVGEKVICFRHKF